MEDITMEINKPKKILKTRGTLAGIIKYADQNAVGHIHKQYIQLMKWTQNHWKINGTYRENNYSSGGTEPHQFHMRIHQILLC